MTRRVSRQPIRGAALAVTACVVGSVVVSVPAPAAPPEGTWTKTNESLGPSAGHNMVFERDATGRLILFGGAVDEGLAADTWVWDGEWRELDPPSSPPGRSNGTVAYDAAREELLLFGGLGTGARELGDTWCGTVRHGCNGRPPSRLPRVMTR